MNLSTRTLALMGALSAGALASSANATFYDLSTAGSSATINGVLFQTDPFRPAGTGVLNPFVRIQANGTEQGYNTSARPVAFDEKTDPNFTRDIQLREFGTVQIGGLTYVQLRLDANEPLGQDRNFISLESLQIFISPTGLHSGTNLDALGTRVYDLDSAAARAGTADNTVRLNAALSSGSGEGDLTVLIPLSVFAGANLNSYVTVYSRFGETDPSEGGFEEWATAGNVIPGPSALAGLGLAAAIGAWRRRRA